MTTIHHFLETGDVAIISEIKRKKALKAIVSLLLKSNPKKAEEISAVKREACRKYSLDRFFRNSEILEALPKNAPQKLRELLRTHKVRSLSGVAVVAIMTRPTFCPHGTCIYCPGGPSSGSPKSYTGKEPAAMRASQNDFDPEKQVTARLKQLEATGHTPQKCEVIVMGGTLNAQPKEYQDSFVKGMYDAFNDQPKGGRFPPLVWSDALTPLNCSRSKNVFEAKEKNQHAPYRVIGLTFETRPDYSTPKKLDSLLDYGATRIELGIQTLDGKILEKANRGHTLKQSEYATMYAKDAFFKIGYHMMPGLFSNPAKDVRMFRTLFSSEKWKPDMLKIYPCLVMPNTGLYELWKQGKFTPYTAVQAAKVIAASKKYIPEYCRVMRVDRDIPTNLIAAGVDKSNLREMVEEELEAKGMECRCIRCREAGLRARFGEEVDWSNVEMKRLNYKASKGDEVFLSFESNDLLLGILRLRLPHKPWRPEIKEAAGVRELHVYGEQLPIKSKKEALQHKSLGAKLLGEAERIAKEEWGMEKLLVISGVGVREYYAKLGYVRDGVYMGRML
ncbi:tRNA uridine(34) 5-carboxymethylaminomethyl modification radical SAM/GNAT enzyme Elp3 [Candidatus Micrarchaeota archaeon]|nr:tRNA uridine(34) 5-carboxymethylaminomethyl modification radical SAM/GNAT enzyme Elp3 [Candidatus Micrarchaeota archaeon]